MADSVARYLVTEQQVPLYRIYRTGLGKNQMQASSDTDTKIVNGVRVTLLHNSLASLNGSDAGTTNTSSPSAMPSQNGQPMPATNQ
jgi:hypothetical protein